MARLAVVRTFSLAAILFGAVAHADEGMWTLDNLPTQKMQERYEFTPTPQWLEHVQKSCVNFGGGSGAFVSAQGLVLTNHHVALNQLQKISSPEHNYLREGFFARDAAEEMPCPDLELKVLWSMEDITAKVKAAIDDKAPREQQNTQRKAVLAKLEQASTQASGLKTEALELYNGGEYWLYRYKTFKDVRLVCAPEEQIAFYGGDSDNFSFPRHDLDFAFFRVYDNGKPYQPEHYIRWSPTGVKEGDLTFVVGHPGRTNRLRTMSQLQYDREISRPTRIQNQEQRLAAYRAYAAKGPEQERQTVNAVRGLENNLKRERGFLEILSDPKFLAAKQSMEDDMRARVAKNEALASADGGAWERIAAAQKLLTQQGAARFYHDMGRVSRLADIANGLVRMTAELEKPNEKRLREYRESNLNSQRFQLLSRAPVYPAMEEHVLTAHLQMCLDAVGPNDPFLKAALGGRAPAEVAHDLITGTKLADVAERKRLLEGGRKAVEASKDPLIVWAREIDAPYRTERQWMEDNIEIVESLEGAHIAHARFALDGKSQYPDASGTLRVSYGKTAGYPQLTTEVPWRTTFLGLFDRARSFDNRKPFDLPARVAAAEKSLDLSTTLNFVTTNDIIGGNSGSPVLDRNGDYVGLVFDGNIQSFLWDFGYSEEQARCVAVDSRGMVEALRKIYGMGSLADELMPVQ